jgi:hypothetical protein
MIMLSCNNAGDKVKDGPTHKSTFDKLEQVFHAGNWRQVMDGDTSYFFFSREGDTHYKIYNYRIKNGDSTATDMAEIKPQDTSVIWHWRDMPAVLTAADARSNTWYVKLPDGSEAPFTIELMDSTHLRWEFPQSVVTLTRTLPVSTFLVRSKYDYEHGTNTANASADTVQRIR